MLEIVLIDGHALAYAPEALCDDRDIVMAAVTKNGLALRYASKALRADRETVMVSVKQDGLAFDFASKALKADIVVRARADAWNTDSEAEKAMLLFGSTGKRTRDDVEREEMVKLVVEMGNKRKKLAALSENTVAAMYAPGTAGHDADMRALENWSAQD